MKISTKCRALLFTLLFIGIFDSISAAQEPIIWSITAEETAKSVRPGSTFYVKVSAKISEPWHLYSTETPENGPRPTRFEVPAGQSFEMAGLVKIPPTKVSFDPNFGFDTEYFEGSAVFTVPVKVLATARAGKNALLINVRYQACTSETCLPPKLAKLELALEVGSGATATGVRSVSTSSARRVETSTAKSPANDGLSDFEFVDFNGKKRKFSEFKGKVVLIDFWATWCGPCLADIPKLRKLNDKYQADGFEVLGMNAETIGDEDSSDPEFAKEADTRARQIVKTRGATWTQANAVSSLPVAVNVFGVKVLPTKILIGRDGKILARIGEKDDTEKIVADAMAMK